MLHYVHIVSGIQFFYSMVQKFSSVKVLAEYFGVDKHPLWKGTMLRLAAGDPHRDVKHKLHSVVDAVMYARDCETQFATFTQARAKKVKTSTRQQRYKASWLQQFGIMSNVQKDFLREAVVDHILQETQAGMVYSLPLEAPVSALHALSRAPDMQHAHQVGNTLDLQRDTDEFESPDVSQYSNQLFFTLLHSGIAKAKATLRTLCKTQQSHCLEVLVFTSTKFASH
eukprot:6194969-Amphidinium_carterae.1